MPSTCHTEKLKLPATAGSDSNVASGPMHPVLLGILGYLIGEKNHIEVVMGQFEVDHGFIFFPMDTAMIAALTI